MTAKENQPDFEEVEVDENLTTFLDKKIPTQKRTYTNTFVEDVDSSDNEDEESPATHKTKEEIYRTWSSVSNEKTEELLPLVERLSKLTEAQAKAYLACLKAMHSQTIHKHLSSRLITFLAYNVCHPKDILTPTAMIEDAFLVNGISLFVSDIMTAVGRLALPLLLSAYAGTSWYWYSRKFEKSNFCEECKENKNETIKAGAATSTVQNDGVRSVSNGQNVSNDQALNEGMDTHL